MHYAIAVIHQEGEDIKSIMKYYDENMRVPNYVKYTKEQLISKGKKDIETYKNGRYSEYLKNPAEYEEENIFCLWSYYRKRRVD